MLARHWIMAFAAALGCVGRSAAQQRSDVLEPLAQYAEVFLEDPKVSGNLLVGLRWASEPGAFDPDNVRVPWSRSNKASRVCVEVMSKDGRYSAENLYNLGDSVVPSPRLKSETKYGDRLRRYPTDDMAVLVREAASCGVAAAKAVLPATVTAGKTATGSSSRRELLAFVNADPERVGVSLRDGRDQIITSGNCRVAGGGVRIAYSAVCSLTVPDNAPSAGMLLRLDVKERFRTVPTNYMLLFP